MAEPTFTIATPFKVDAANILASNVPENDAPLWVASTNYKAKERVIYQHKIHESVADQNVGRIPGAAGSETFWLLYGPTNKFAAFDNSIGTKTAQPGLITYTLGGLDAFPTTFAAIGLVDSFTVNIKILENSVVKYEKEFNTAPQISASDWWSFWFGEWTNRETAVDQGLPVAQNATFQITITGGASLAVGVIMIGQQRSFGYGADGNNTQFDSRSRAQIKEDAWGREQFIPGITQNKGTFPVLIERGEVDGLRQYLRRLGSSPALFIASEFFESGTIWGRCLTSPIELKNHLATVTFSITEIVNAD